MSKPDLTDDALEALFDAAKQDAPEMAPEFLAKLQGQAVQAVTPRGEGRKSLLERLRDSMAGFSAAGGLVVATAVGFWIGVSPPQMLDAPLSTSFGVPASDEIGAWFEFQDAELFLEDG